MGVKMEREISVTRLGYLLLLIGGTVGFVLTEIVKSECFGFLTVVGLSFGFILVREWGGDFDRSGRFEYLGANPKLDYRNMGHSHTAKDDSGLADEREGNDSDAARKAGGIDSTVDGVTSATNGKIG